MNKGDFLGRDALRRQKEEGAKRKLCCLVLTDPTAVALGNEPVSADGKVISRVTSGGYGYAVAESIAYAYLPMALSAFGSTLAIDVDGKHVSATVQRDPRHDPDSSRIKA